MPRLVPALLLFLTVTSGLLGGCRESMYPRSDKAPEGNPSAAYSALLTQVVTHDGYVNYDLLEENRGPLDDYVAWMAWARRWRLEDPVGRAPEYINAYNALVLFQVLERGRPASVMDVQGILGVPGGKFFSGTQFKIGREWLSLSEIEHERVRNQMLDYRVHAALNCASADCPPLRRELYTRRGLGIQLREQMGAWLADERGLRFDGETPVFSPIMDWFEHDFHFWTAGENLCEIGLRYTAGERQRKLRIALDKGCPHRFFEYDWSLNAAPTVAE